MSSSTENGEDSGEEEAVASTSRLETRRRVSASSAARLIASANGVWPEPFVESLAVNVAMEAYNSVGPLAAGPALANLFMVCSTWRSVSTSETLWRVLCSNVWGFSTLTRASWRSEYAFRHRTASNFRNRQSRHFTLQLEPTSPASTPTCRRIGLSDRYLALGFLDGSVRAFDLRTRAHLGSYCPAHSDRLGPYSRAVSGLVIDNDRLVFALLDGNVYEGDISGWVFRRVLAGNVVDNGTCVDFNGNGRFWVGLFAGVPGRAVRVWDAVTEETLFVGGDLTDPDAVRGWRLLTEPHRTLGRVRVGAGGLVVACTESRVSVVFGAEDEIYESFGDFMVGCFDAHGERCLVVSRDEEATIRHLPDLNRTCEFEVEGVATNEALGCMNWTQGFVCSEGVIGTWDLRSGENLYHFREDLGEATAIVADDLHVAAVTTDALLHLWSFAAL
ncbi:hypothetical protein AMTRI_Chr10g2860 [Amborella trichopoda]